MEINRIDQNTIRVRLSRDELEERGIDGLDMLSDRNKIQDFFYSILSEIDSDHDFAQNEPISFQVMPNNGGLDLLISKSKDGGIGSLQKILQGDKAEKNNHADDVPDEFYDLLDDSKEEAASDNFTQLGNRNDRLSRIQDEADKNDKNYHRAYLFNDLSEVIELADNLQAADIASSLYYKNGNYFLELAFLNEDYSELSPNDAWAIANEYGIKISDQHINMIKEIGDCIFRQDALGNIRHYFLNVNRI